MTSAHSFVVGTPIRSRTAPLTLDQIRRSAPSAFATEAYEGMSGRYTYIPTSDIIEGMVSAGFQPFAVAQSRTRVEDKAAHTKHMIRFRTDNSALRVGDVFPEIVLVNSHDGTSAYKLMAGMFRLACSNGLTVAESMIESVSVRHQGDIAARVIEGSYELIERVPMALEAVADWKSIALTPAQQGAFAEAAHTIRFADADGTVDTPITPAQLLAPRRREDTGPDLWSTFNRVQENAVKGGLRARRPRQPGERGTIRVTTTREVKGISEDVRLNRALWQLTERMAELAR